MKRILNTVSLFLTLTYSVLASVASHNDFITPYTATPQGSYSVQNTLRGDVGYTIPDPSLPPLPNAPFLSTYDNWPFMNIPGWEQSQALLVQKIQNLPVKLLESLGLPAAQTDFFIVMQGLKNLNANPGENHYLLQPHFWAHSHLPGTGGVVTPVEAHMWQQGGGQLQKLELLKGHGQSAKNFGVNSHDGTLSANERKFQPVDNTNSQIYWSALKVTGDSSFNKAASFPTQPKGKSVVTLHILLNPADYNAMSNFLLSGKTDLAGSLHDLLLKPNLPNFLKDQVKPILEQVRRDNLTFNEKPFATPKPAAPTAAPSSSQPVSPKPAESQPVKPKPIKPVTPAQKLKQITKAQTKAVKEEKSAKKDLSKKQKAQKKTAKQVKSAHGKVKKSAKQVKGFRKKVRSARKKRKTSLKKVSKFTAQHKKSRSKVYALQTSLKGLKGKKKKAVQKKLKAEKKKLKALKRKLSQAKKADKKAQKTLKKLLKNQGKSKSRLEAVKKKHRTSKQKASRSQIALKAAKKKFAQAKKKRSSLKKKMTAAQKALKKSKKKKSKRKRRR